MPKPVTFILLFFIQLNISAQTIRGIVTDTSGKSLAFATIKIGDTKQGLMADLAGKFKIRISKSFSYITVTYLGYKPEKIYLENVDTARLLRVTLQASDAKLDEVVVRSAGNKIRRILNHALANRNSNNPDKYDWYQCNVYYKLLVDATPDSVALKFDSTDMEEMRQFKNSQYFFITETFSRRTWERPQKLQEEVLGSRISGFKKAWMTSLVTDVLPFHGYSDFLTLNGKDYHNPLSPGLFQRYDFRLEDEILQGKDTIWHISFTPKKNTEELSGSLFISSNMFAIADLKAEHYDANLKRLVGIEQQYIFDKGRWFPEQLNYIVKWESFAGQPAELSMTGRSVIDSVSFDKDVKFRFDKAHTSKILPGADELSEKKWEELRPLTLDKKETRTYVFMDSLGKAEHFDNIPRLAERFAQGYFPAGALDIEIQRLYSYNKYEKHRLGFGFRTSNKVSTRFATGAWFGYGTGDKNIKYEGWAEVYADKYKEFIFRLNVSSDLQDPGRLQINPELDKTFLRRFLLGRVDKIKSYGIEVSKRIGYWQTNLAYNKEEFIPQYNYQLVHSGKSWSSFKTNEIVLGFRYAYAERMTPLMGKYYSNGSKYPIVYGKIRLGEIENDNNKYIQAVGGVKWQKHLNRIGNEQFLLLAGGVLSKDPLPLSKLFAGNGFQLNDNSFYVFGGMQTMLPYQYYSDKFINFYWKHDFDFKFYNLKLTKTFSSSPTLSFGYNVLYGKLKHAGAHQSVQFSVPSPAYHELGIMFNRIIRMKFMGMAYFNFNAGYYYHLNGPFDHKQNGRFVFGISADL